MAAFPPATWDVRLLSEMENYAVAMPPVSATSGSPTVACLLALRY
jgi:hypothetical protein